MMFRQAAIRSNLQRLAVQSRFKTTGVVASQSPIPSGVLNSWYKTFGKSSAVYATWMMTLIVVGEFATGKVTDGIWTMNNYGSTFTTADWSKFDPREEEDDDEEDDDDDDE